MKNLLLNILKWFLYIIFIPIFWIYGFFWLLFASRKHSDNSVSIHATLTIISVCICSAFVFQDPKLNTKNDMIQANTEIQPEETPSNKIYNTNYIEPYTPEEIESRYVGNMLLDSSETYASSQENIAYKEEIPTYAEHDSTYFEEEPTYTGETYTDPVQDYVFYDNSVQEQTLTEPINETMETNSNNSQIVWIDDTAPKYHSSAEQPNHNFKMDNPKPVTREEAENVHGKKPCGICYR
jgi:hypothetical protein